MGNYLDILILAMLAAFIIFRLRSVLGRRTGNERPPGDVFSRNLESDKSGDKKSRDRDNVVALPERDEAAAEKPAAKKPKTPLEKGIAAIQAADASFDEAGFVDGAKGAFEMIVTSFAMGDLGKVKAFLAKEVYENFADAVEERLKAKETLETTVVGFKDASLIEARMADRNAQVTVKFVSEQINATRDRDGAVIDGDPEKPVDVTDIWTFARDTKSRDPNWALVETSSPS
ncbi:MAG TPA: Tim44/TimA family putative adaptor protein [Alphaproteobacteria bacterium]|nr:Tim44/TimA family putative adaptor protein [Alphaproteobacteria bacterium]